MRIRGIESPQLWFVCFRRSKVKPLEIMKVRGFRADVLKAVRSAGYKVPFLFSFDGLIKTQSMTHGQFALRYTNYSKDYYYNFVQKIDLWGRYPKYDINQIPKNDGGQGNDIK